jgi:hypothetical protein
LAIIADGGRAIVVIYREGVEINYFLLYFIDSAKTLRRRSHPTPSEEAPGGAVCLSIKTMPMEGKTAPSWWGFFSVLCLASQKVDSYDGAITDGGIFVSSSK